ncbi:3-hydroxyisobutyrate dehydrogenase [Filimonas lacunae]|uniref:3-hydroxyisobutyrate dehydrogenase n=1 Tax=Filimonas lacunae TaxID=477680 RepID=A0A173MF46_9BACT|nr:NAD(P)-dependent oxidoreductase [Filimonas lacunae]BAV06116.1 2-hydroxy-3-oxopropionate reductase [Filimonas lacunae]SIT24720.1 3-hydroxyisobutyrate dehydrogenase [Filimonas lacunae]
MIAFLGTGLLGGNFVRALIKKGNEVQVWNRTAAKATALEADGAKAFENAADAVKGAARIHITLKDDASVNEVLAQALPGLQPGAVIIDHTTTSIEGAVERTQHWQQQGFTYLHVPVFMGPANALEGTGFMLVSGNQEVIQQWESTLAGMTGKVLNFGPEEGKAAGMKLTGNAFLVTLTGGLADTLTLAKSMGVSLSEVATLFDNWNPGALLPARLQRMGGGKYDTPSWELNMARKDTQLFLDAAQQGGVNLTVIPAVAALMDQFIARGHGNNDWTVIGKDAVS